MCTILVRDTDNGRGRLCKTAIFWICFFARDETALKETADKYGISLLRMSENITHSRADVVAEVETRRLSRVIDGFVRGLDDDTQYVL